ncbi:uncharacterized protein F4822DRAFT_44986 [Hypoxylon trugodes]|uniref:uncharacterized protein n=1 Tax=Hypoxylon trugodes TaxID=326681 RepID=UPI0021A11151|nr:uncharacterized protein F4822DRAFT_44986 [Hypoxylon trugodes]KAI1394309.1 hypothetical protein F4822DRAFT_44986 [Hypoxylon trugodes]
MAATPNPLASSGSAPVPSVSRSTLTVSGLKVDVYGLAELHPAATNVSCLWLHHPRLRSKEDMTNIAGQVLSAYHQKQTTRGLIAVAFDQRNHGTRLVDELANEDWRRGNKTHAQDMLGTITGTVVDNINLLDLLPGYLFGNGDGPGASSNGGKRHIDHNLVLGISLGGHTAWQLLFADPRVTAGVMVIGCPDYMNLMKDRARLSRLETYGQSDEGASFFGSKDFPDALVATCNKYDPKTILFGMDAPYALEAEVSARKFTQANITGKRFQILSGGADKLVPYSASEPFLQHFKAATSAANIYVEDNVYLGIGHQFTPNMKNDAVRFILDSVALADPTAPPKI